MISTRLGASRRVVRDVSSVFLPLSATPIYFAPGLANVSTIETFMCLASHGSQCSRNRVETLHVSGIPSDTKLRRNATPRIHENPTKAVGVGRRVFCVHGARLPSVLRNHD